MLIFLLSSILRAVGDTVRPLIFLIISSMLNIILDPILIKGFLIIPAMGLEGAAIATVISQFTSVLISTTYLRIEKQLHTKLILLYSHSNLKMN